MKHINLTIPDEIYDWLKSNQYNISAWIRAIIQKVYTEMCIKNEDLYGKMYKKNAKNEPSFPVENSVEEDFKSAGL